MSQSFLIRYGTMGQVGRFAAEPAAAYDRGQAVVVRSHRGTELGEVLIPLSAPGAGDPPPSPAARVLRAAGPDDLERARRLGAEREARYVACQRVFAGGVWPIDLIDVEPLLDDGRTVLYYLGPHRLDAAGLLAAFRSATALDVLFEPVGRDMPEDETEPDPEAADSGCDRCGSSGGCGSGGGGCGTGSSSGSGGCSTCGVHKLLAARR